MILTSNLRESRFSRIQYFYLVLELRWLASPFTSRSRGIWISFSLLEKSKIKINFTFNFSKRVKLCKSCVKNGLYIKPKYNIYNDYILQNLRIFSILENFSRILEKFHFSISISRHFHFTFHFSKRVNQIFISLFTSRTFNIHSRRTLPGEKKFFERKTVQV